MEKRTNIHGCTVKRVNGPWWGTAKAVNGVKSHHVATCTGGCLGRYDRQGIAVAHVNDGFVKVPGQSQAQRAVAGLDFFSSLRCPGGAVHYTSRPKFRDPRSIQERWELAQDTADCKYNFTGSGKCALTKQPYSDGDWMDAGADRHERHDAYASMQLDGIACEDLP